MVVGVSLLDRLLSDVSETEQRVNQSDMQLPHYSKAEYREHVRRDLELLLNTPRTPLWLTGLAGGVGGGGGGGIGVRGHALAASHSVLSYGVPDVTTLNFTDAESVGQYCRSLASLIEQHEPRFEHVQVQLLPPEIMGAPYRLSIEATLRMNPAPEVIAFDSELMPGGQRIVLSHAAVT